MEKHLWKVFVNAYHGEVMIVTYSKSISQVEEVAKEHEFEDITTIQYVGIVFE